MFEPTLFFCFEMATMNLNDHQKKKRPRLGPRYQMEIGFSDEDSKTTFLSRIERAKSSLSSNRTQSIDNYTLLSLLLDNFEETKMHVSYARTIVPIQRKPVLKQSSI